MYTLHTFEMGIGPKDIEGLSMFAIADMARPAQGEEIESSVAADTMARKLSVRRLVLRQDETFAEAVLYFRGEKILSYRCQNT